MPWSNLVKPLRTLGDVLRGSVPRFFWCGGPPSGQIGSVKLGQPRSNFLKLWEMCFGSHLEVILMWWALIESGWLGPGYLVLRVDARENPGGKNRVITRPQRDLFIFHYKMEGKSCPNDLKTKWGGPNAMVVKNLLPIYNKHLFAQYLPNFLALVAAGTQVKDAL